MDALVAPLSGGGLLSGLAVTTRALQPAVELTGVSMTGGAAMIASIAAGRMRGVDETPTLADALAGELPLDNRYTFRICRDLVDRLTTVEEEQIRHAMAWAYRREGLVIEGAAAVGLAWLLAGRCPRRCRHVALVVSGGNIDEERLRAIIRGVDETARPG